MLGFFWHGKNDPMGAISQFHDSRRCLTLKLSRHTADSEWRESKGELLVPKNKLKKAQPSTCMQIEGRQDVEDKKEQFTMTGWWFQIFFMFIPTWGRFPFQMGWNHQPDDLHPACGMRCYCQGKTPECSSCLEAWAKTSEPSDFSHQQRLRYQKCGLPKGMIENSFKGIYQEFLRFFCWFC